MLISLSLELTLNLIDVKKTFFWNENKKAGKLKIATLF
ncbi:hypothetical protein A5819_001274 [Enterococcus sp. 7E2_DIV0204]|uniref:Uncharacterized protein n=1 Tax=Candidatus Enterococcus lemimoniae TaxID=1834167 RepID=A0ABZ2T6Y4_9ENTE|nr:hypothetical protein A5819_001274 [Enterococcus sp. 7E2_DIV0204]OTO70961.1 hypothetical protein A5866_003211 [Enterococcus sp. 12C11_DIV0727]OTP51246.1 hypothetical protein A5884_000441 [Enterococcus sp. 7D2_DIV0200]